MAALRLRDRDAIITKEGLVLRVLGYSHPRNAYICDVEYAPAEIFKSSNPKAFRSRGQQVFYKFYEDEGLEFVKNNYPQYLIFHDILNTKVAGVHNSDIVNVEKPKEELEKLMKTEPKDELTAVLQNVLKIITHCSNLSIEDFGVFGSILHGFYHPRFSDLDLVIYGRENAVKLREALRGLYEGACSLFKNEFESDEQVKGKHWRFQNYGAKEYVWHQRRKVIYALFTDEKSGRIIKTEFEPVKDWNEACNEYDTKERILQKGWVKMLARVADDRDASFIPSIYRIEPLHVLTGTKGANGVKRVVSYMEEFRMQAWKDEKVYVEGNLEEVITPSGSFHQIALTYCPRYYEQVLKVVS